MRPSIDKISMLTQLERVAALSVTQSMLNADLGLERAEAIFAALHSGASLLPIGGIDAVAVHLTRRLSKQDAYWAAAAALAVYQVLGEEGMTRVVEFLAYPMGLIKILMWAEAEAERSASAAPSRAAAEEGEGVIN